MSTETERRVAYRYLQPPTPTYGLRQRRAHWVVLITGVLLWLLVFLAGYAIAFRT